MKKFLLLLLVILLVPALITSTEAPSNPVVEQGHTLADDTHWHYDPQIGPGSGWYISTTQPTGTGFYGNFELTSGSDISFFLVDSDNFVKWEAGSAFYSKVTFFDATEGDYHYRTTYDDTWYFIFSNRDALLTNQTVSYDCYIDRTAPVVTSCSLSPGTTYSGIIEISVEAEDAQFTVSRIVLTIADSTRESEYSDTLSWNWDTEQYTNGDWEVTVRVYDNVGNDRTYTYLVTVYNLVTVEPTTTGDPTTTRPTYVSPLSTMLPVFTLLAGVALVIGAVVYAKSGKDETPPPTISVKPPEPPTTPKPIPAAKPVPEPEPIPEADPTSSKIIERTTVERVIVLFMCPYCGAKNEQGITKCANCQAEI